jgi:protein gp37
MPAFGAGQHRDKVETFLDYSKLYALLKRKKPTKFFWCDMTDLFGAWVSQDQIDTCFAAMVLAEQHTHQILTKRSARLMQYMNDPMTPMRVLVAMQKLNAPLKWNIVFDSDAWPPPNIWCGVSAGNQEQADARVTQLLSTKAAIRFVSAEPLLGLIEMPGLCFHSSADPNQHDHSQCATTLDWIIVGGESGPGARPMGSDWVRGLRDQCIAAGVAFFFKQWGAWVPPTQNMCVLHGSGGTHEYVPNGRRHSKNCPNAKEYVVRVGKKRAGRELDGREWSEFPAKASVPV